MFTNKQASHIQDGYMNDAIKQWQDAQPERDQRVASPSSLTQCPRTVFWRREGKEPTNPKTWAFKQRLLLGRNFENMIATQLDFSGVLLHHWKDDVAGESDKFTMGEGLARLEGTPDLLLKLGDSVAISDAKTGRSDGYGYVPTTQPEIWEDPFWHKYKLQLTAYYMLSHANKDWFKAKGLLLPEVCHLFSYAMDDGVIRREFTWKPEKSDAETVVKYAKRWNAAYQAKTLPPCTCTEKDTMFCEYADPGSAYQTKKGKTLFKECCK